MSLNALLILRAMDLAISSSERRGNDFFLLLGGGSPMVPASSLASWIQLSRLGAALFTISFCRSPPGGPTGLALCGRFLDTCLSKSLLFRFWQMGLGLELSPNDSVLLGSLLGTVLTSSLCWPSNGWLGLDRLSACKEEFPLFSWTLGDFSPVILSNLRPSSDLSRQVGGSVCTDRGTRDLFWIS